MRIKLHDTEVAEVMSELMEENCPGVVWLAPEQVSHSHESEHMKQVYQTLSELMTEFSALPTRSTRKVTR